MTGQKWQWRLTTTRVFSGVEFLFGATILLILLFLFSPKLLNANKAAQIDAHRFDRTSIDVQIENYFLSTGRYPAGMGQVDWGKTNRYFVGPVPTLCNQGVKWEIDPTTHHLSRRGHEEHEAL